MSELVGPYVGVSGVVSVEQHQLIMDMWEGEGLESVGRVALLGVKATAKPQVYGIENKYGRDWYPVGDQLSRAVTTTEPGAPVLQLFSDWGTDEAYQLLDKTFERSAGWLQGVQFDKLPWFDDTQNTNKILSYAKSSTGLPVLVQCYGDIMQTAEPASVVARLKRLHEMGLIDYVLFDSSEGTGTLMEPKKLLKWVELTKKATPTLSVGVAGGLSAESIDTTLRPLVREFPDISWDAEGRLHYPVPPKGTGSLDMSAVRGYLSASAAILS